MLVDVVDGSHDSLPEFLFGGDADVAEQTIDSMKRIVCDGFFVSSARCSLVHDSRNEVEDHDGTAAGGAIGDDR